MKKNFLKGMLLAGGMMLMTSGTALASDMEVVDYYENDVTPPWGRISIVGATEVNNVNYVDKQNVTVQIYAADDMCQDSEIKYYISTSEIFDTTKLTTWYDYAPGKTHPVTLPNTTSTNTIYAIFKDVNGNTSLIYDSSLSQTVVYDLNATDAEMATGMATTRIHGAPFVVTSQTPKREGYYFKGWAINQYDGFASYRQGDIIPADVEIGTDTTATFYAVWTTEAEGLPLLADVIEVGDYVNYPVYYDNVPTNGSSYTINYKGWRVLSKDVDIDGKESKGTVNLVSAGVPLTYYCTGYSNVENLIIKFLSTKFSNSGATFRKTGFNPYQTLSQIFNNKYTATYDSDTTVTCIKEGNQTTSGTKLAGTLKVRAMTKEDLDKVYDPSGKKVTEEGSYVTAAKYDGLLAIPTSNPARRHAYYWLASACSYNLWCVRR